MDEIIWEKMKIKKREKLIKNINKLANKIKRNDFDRVGRTKLMTKIKFNACRMLQRSLRNNDTQSLDCLYWEDEGFLDKIRPWKDNK